jgi:hypothetical protein
LKLGLQQDANYEKRWTDELGTLLETLVAVCRCVG